MGKAGPAAQTLNRFAWRLLGTEFLIGGETRNRGSFSGPVPEIPRILHAIFVLQQSCKRNFVSFFIKKSITLYMSEGYDS
jgi:hypothetical protein